MTFHLPPSVAASPSKAADRKHLAEPLVHVAADIGGRGIAPTSMARVDALFYEYTVEYIAVEGGYFDQAHMVREFRSLSTLTPAHYLRSQIRMPSHVAADGQKYPIPTPTEPRSLERAKRM